jgi:antitoxin YefM
VTRILVMSETLSLAEIKAHLSEIVDRIEGQHERVTLTRNGRPAAVLISPEDLEALEDTLELLADPTARAEIEEARQEIARGEGIRADELRARYLGKT